MELLANKIKKLYQKYKAVIAYLFWGVVTTVINIGIFMVWVKLGLNYQVGNVIAWFFAVLVAYISNKIWVFSTPFRNMHSFFTEMGSFFFFRIMTLVIDIIITWIGITLLQWDTFIVKVLDNVVVVLANYFFSKWYIFKKIKQ
ncbi:GtrA family protein [Liquorilactobacillus oeni]|uniref:GtcA family membrane protein n=1 Tax=Liquorilactobacillus oeni DSM 19972 TaxID=1423777 RepID=A0A0R1MD26_9LACO|nr:GtrA family protein [Liquorilactobacillus oeni]KRL06014.1 GtcA family membrane protein [Liquorilactobacillus oeni DSM 19972]